MADIIIRDPVTGIGAEVNEQKELVVRAINETELEHASAKGRAYAWSSGELDIDAGDTMLFIQNTSSTPLILDRMLLNGGNVICQWTIAIGVATTTGTGTAVTGVNLNTLFSGSTPEANAYSDETALADAITVIQPWTAVTTSLQVDLDGIILGKNHYIQVNQETESTSGSAHITGHYANPS